MCRSVCVSGLCMHVNVYMYTHTYMAYAYKDTHTYTHIVDLGLCLWKLKDKLG